MHAIGSGLMVYHRESTIYLERVESARRYRYCCISSLQVPACNQAQHVLAARVWLMHLQEWHLQAHEPVSRTDALCMYAHDI